MTAITLNQLSEFLASQGFPTEIDGDGEISLSAVNTLEDAAPGEISFLSNPKYKHLLDTTKASAVIVDREVGVPDRLVALRCDDPYAGMTTAIVRIHGYRAHPRWGIDRRAVIAEDATIGARGNIAHEVTIRDHVIIGEDVTVYPGCYIGDHTTLGDGVTLFPNVVIYDHSQIGNRVTIHAGTVVGQDGLGYAPHNGGWLKIPQIGRVIIEDDVELGAGCAVDRATMGTTRIGRGTKLSDLVVIGHGTRIGEDCMIVAQVGIAGSTTVGNHVTLAGQVGISGHLAIGDDVKVGAQSGVRSNLETGGEYMGSPAVDSTAFRRQTSLVHRLPQLKQRLRDLETEVAELRKRVEDNDRFKR